MKYFNYETSKNRIADLLAIYLKENKIYFEVSGVTAGMMLFYHFEIYTDNAGADVINNYLDSIY